MAGRRTAPSSGPTANFNPDALLVMVLKADRLRTWLEEVRSEPDIWEEWLPDEIVDRLAAAERFEAACAQAIEAPGIVLAKQTAQDRAQDLHEIMFDIREHWPRTVAGVLIMARALMAYEEAQIDAYGGDERGGGLVLIAGMG
ncbi:hypothetical protein GGD66_006979 [Bradyrhizobium sp. CIR48]|uniref:hypothetical protein n=1 Tax=Bradyrhizobium sp. CIR48 TaxID=2663840 RepID=UPI00160627D4|nr:hypothetical protein [Bradyrhizobium sp. CIR48]MBB4428392.1 hypothetical protein [Bradyrhizobium sp. CIR48]